jgi:hypothetical protein
MNLEAVMKRCRREEGAVPWMYLDSAKPPNVTVGEGHLIADAAEAQKLGFMAGDRLATPQEVAAEFTRVAALPGGHSADYYEAHTALRLSTDRMDAILSGDIASHEAATRAKLPAFDSWPESVQEAVFDIGYNCGIVGLLGFHRMLAAIAEHDWQTAGVCSHRKGISDDRNKETASLFFMAAAGEGGQASGSA